MATKKAKVPRSARLRAEANAYHDAAAHLMVLDYEDEAKADAATSVAKRLFRRSDALRDKADDLDGL